MAPFARIRARITSSFRKAKGILAKIIYGEYFYDFTEQDTNGFVGAGGGESVINDYLVADGAASNYIRTPIIAPSSPINVKKFEFEFYLKTAIFISTSDPYVSKVFSNDAATDNRVVLGQITGSYGDNVLHLRFNGNNHTVASFGGVASIPSGHHKMTVEWNGSNWEVTLEGYATEVTVDRQGSPGIAIYNNEAFNIMGLHNNTSDYRNFQNNGYVKTLKMWDTTDTIILNFKNIYGANGTTYDWSGYTFTRYVGDATQRETITVPGQYRIENTGTGAVITPQNGFVEFNNTANDYLYSDSADFDMTTGSFSFGAFINIDASESSGAVLSKYLNTGNQRSYCLYFNTTMQLIVSSNGSATASVTAAISKGVNVSIAGVVDLDNDLIKISINGGTFITAVYTNTLHNSTADFWIGNMNGGSEPFNGKIYNTWFYNRVLEQAEVTAIHNSSNSLRYYDLTTELLDGLVSWYDFEAVLDDLNGSNNLVKIGSPAIANTKKHLSPYTGIVGKFDGTSEIKTSSTPTSFVTNNWFVSARIKYTTYATLDGIFSCGNLGVFVSNKTAGTGLLVGVSSSQYSQFDYSFINGENYHIVAIYDGSQPTVDDRCKLYINGVEIERTSVNGGLPTTVTISGYYYIGEVTTYNRNFIGTIYDLLFVNALPTLTQIQQLAVRPEVTKNYLVDTVGITWSNVAAFYPLTENGGDTAYDYSDNANHGTWTNPAYETGLSTVRQLGLQNVSRYSPFDGINDVVNVSTPVTLSEGTIAFWFMPLESIYNRVIGSNGSPNLSYINPKINSSQVLVRINNNSNQMFFTDPLPMTIGNWYHIAVTFNSTTANCFVNGIACAENPFTIPVSSQTFQVYNLGRLWQTTTYGKQILDEVAVWNTMLSQDNITDIYNGALASDYSSANLQLYYKDCFINSQGVFKDLSGNGNDGTPNGSMETITLPEKETIAGIPYDVFGFECNSQNIVGEEETFALRGLGYVDYDGHAGPYTDVKQIQFIIKPTSNNHAYILTDEANNRVAYINGNQVVSDFGTNSIYIDDVETDVILTDVWQQVTIEFTTPVDIEKLYIGSSAVPDAFEEFGIDKLNIVKE